MPGDVLIIDSISKSFGHVEAVRSLSANLPTGCIYGFLGPNGTGILMYGKPPSLREIIRWVRYG